MGAICRGLHVLPRGGGVLDQPATEVAKLEAVLTAYGKYDEKEAKKRDSRRRTRARAQSEITHMVEEEM